MASATEIRERIFNYAYGSGHGKRPFAHRINGAYTAGGTVTMDDGAKFTVNDVLEFQPLGMQARVESIATNVLTLDAGLNGTVDANLADNVTLFNNPRFTIKDADDAVKATLEVLEDYNIFVIGTGTITLVANQFYYDLTDSDIVEPWGVLGLFEQDATDLIPRPLPFHYYAGIHATLSTSGHGIKVWYWGNSTAGDTLYFTYAKKIDATTDLTTRQEEMVVKGSVAQLMGTDIIPRTMDPGKRTDRTVQPGQTGRDSRWFQAEFQRALWREEARWMTEIEQLPTTRSIARVNRLVF